MRIRIRPLSKGDMPLLTDLRMEVLAHVFADQRKTMSDEEWENLRQANARYYSEELEKGGHIACLAMAEGEIAGCGGICIYREMPSPDNRAGICAYLMNIYTRKPYRRQGVSREVCRWLIERAKERGAEKIYLETSECARTLYHSMGFREMRDYLKLDEDRHRPEFGESPVVGNSFYHEDGM